jgi:branched-chain amino acid transport system substrate-binding protein
MNKRIVTGLILLVALLSVGALLAACGGGGSTATTLETTTLAPTTTLPPATGGTVKIGEIRSLTGNLAMSSELMNKAFDLAFAQIGYQVANKNIQIIIGDSKGDPTVAVDVARKMVENDKVDVIVGATTVGENFALATYCNQAGVPHILNSAFPIGAVAKNNWVIAAGGTPAQLSSPMGDYLYTHLNYKKIDILTQDNTSGRAFLTPLTTTFKARGGEVVQETYTAFPAPDFAPYLTALKPADALVAWTAGADAIKFLTQYHEMGIDKTLPLVGAFHGSFLVPVVVSELPAATGDALVGDLVPSPYSPDLDTDVNRAFVEAVKANMGVALPDDNESGPYGVALLIIEALKATNGDTTRATFMQALLNVHVTGPEGTVSVDQATKAMIKNVYICKLAKVDTGYALQHVFTYEGVGPNGLQ